MNTRPKPNSKQYTRLFFYNYTLKVVTLKWLIVRHQKSMGRFPRDWGPLARGVLPKAKQWQVGLPVWRLIVARTAGRCQWFYWENMNIYLKAMTGGWRRGNTCAPKVQFPKGGVPNNSRLWHEDKDIPLPREIC